MNNYSLDNLSKKNRSSDSRYALSNLSKKNRSSDSRYALSNLSKKNRSSDSRYALNNISKKNRSPIYRKNRSPRAEFYPIYPIYDSPKNSSTSSIRRLSLKNILQKGGRNDFFWY